MKPVAWAAAGAALLSIGAVLAGCDDPKTPVSSSGVSSGKTHVNERAVWMTNFELAQSQAKIEKKPIFISFSGSDWCGWCIKLDREVFSRPAFADWAAKNVILFLADFPQNTPQSAEVKKQNEELAKKYGVDGFPTVVLVNADGKELGRAGYQPGGAESYVKMLDGILKK